jgi:hypothetical protein
METGNNLSPRLVALAKDSALKVFLDSWDFHMTFKEIKEYLFLDIKNNDKIIINKNFIDVPKKELCERIDLSYSIFINLIMDTLRFVGRPNDGFEIDFNNYHSH